MPSSPATPLSDRIHNQPALGPVAAELLSQAARHIDPTAFLGEALLTVLSATGGTFLALAAPLGGQWVATAQVGPRQVLPTDLLAEVVDRETPQAADGWFASLLAPRTNKADALVLRNAKDSSPQTLGLLATLAEVLDEGLTAVAGRQQDRRRILRLETILAIAQQWNQAREIEPLLVQMAEAATRLLECDRASIFLWDRRTHTLVGRPALGVKDGQLRIADDQGVVGRVVQTGQPLRVDAATEPARIDRRVDAQLGYETHSLLCVPLRGKSGELFGAFELINKRAGLFSADDEAALVELAAQAAITLENAQDRQSLLTANRQMAAQAAEQVQLIGQSPAMEALRSIVQRVADTELAVLILGENGTGKEVVAHSIHYLSRRCDKPFIAVNCAAIPDTLAESELFGHERGAFTDAHEARPGKFELASNGTLFLDEIGDLSLSGQGKLLRVLEEKVLVRVGGSTPISTDARVIAATNQQLAEMVRQKRFREDLYFRLNVVTLEIPPLRNRPEDILLLGEHFLDGFCRRARRKTPAFTPAARQRLQAHAWPGNVRELRNLMERLAYLSTGDQVDVEDLAFILSPRSEESPILDPGRTLVDATVKFQTEYIRRAIDQAGGNMSQAATNLGLHRSNLYRKLRQLGMPVS